MISRRNFLRAGAVVLGLPRLECMALADGKAAPNRMVLICAGFGFYAPSFFPEQPGPDYTPSEYLKVLGDFRDQFTVFSGISHQAGGDHASESIFLTGAKNIFSNTFRNTVSLDTVAAQHVGNATRYPLLSLATDDTFPLTKTATGASVQGLSRPSDIFARLFLTGKPEEVAQEVARLKHGESILDRMGDRLSALKSKLGSGDRQQLADYTESVRDMEKTLHANEVWAMKPKPAVGEPPPADVADKADVIGRMRLLFHLTKLALRTDSTRVVSIFIRGLDMKPKIDGVTQDHHGLSHHGMNPAKIEELRMVERAELGAFREFLASLRETKEGGASLLDRTQVLLGSNLGDASGHGTTNLPILLAGGGFRHGQHIAGDRRNNTPLAKLYVSMLRRFGVETDSFASVAGPIDGLA